MPRLHWLEHVEIRGERELASRELFEDVDDAGALRQDGGFVDDSC